MDSLATWLPTVRLFISALALCWISVSSAKEKLDLPGRYYDPQILKIEPIAERSNFDLALQVKIPKGQKLNTRGRSSLNVFEKYEGKWFKTGTVQIKQPLFSASNKLSIKETIHLQTKTGDVAIGATVLHCAKRGGLCVIDNFQGKIVRSPKAKSKTVAVTLTATPPQF